MTQVRRRFVWEIDWNLLRTFTIIVQEGSLTAAGDKLSLSQPTISNALRRLEDHMACRLVDRSSNYFRVTPAGETLYEECMAMFTIVAGLPELMEQDRNQVAGYVEMAFASHVDCPFLDIFLADFHKAHPRITFSTTVSSSHAAAEAVRNNEAVLGIFLAQEKLEELEYTLLYREHFGFFCGPTHPLFEQRIEGFDALRILDYVSFTTDDVSGPLASIAELRRREQLRGQIVGRFTNLEEVKRLIKAGFGFGPLPIHVVAAEIEVRQLWQLPPYENPPSVDVYLVTKRHTRRTRAQSVFVDALLAAIRATPLEKRTYPESALRAGPPARK
ncbi:MAG: LysR family transcriptional regulator [Mesorhizobium sp.]|uniref:LysR family transcriptional regulator n=1 Tax=Mesorhizobium sp. TaxID=1871066 RepID=UPI001221F4D0|nr:LysR family transcriptional regulator [Mesorhizobium sp.]TIL60579.1 MAG: LysR family transcriptional regulator [Mesorhizobium sp.]